MKSSVSLPANQEHRERETRLWPSSPQPENMTDDKDAVNTATRRLDQINSHVQSNTKAKRGKAKQSRGSALPADWSDVLGELDVVKKFAQTPKYELCAHHCLLVASHSAAALLLTSPSTITTS